MGLSTWLSFWEHRKSDLPAEPSCRFIDYFQRCKRLSRCIFGKDPFSSGSDWETAILFWHAVPKRQAVDVELSSAGKQRLLRIDYDLPCSGWGR